ncbi:MAG: hypothetical protein P8X91_08585 [Candidatus Bathyarchaeota archaeon]
MYKIVTKQELAPNIYMIELKAADIAKKANPGQFVIIRLDEKGERVPLTIAGINLKEGTLSVAFHDVGRTTKKLAKRNSKKSVMFIMFPQTMVLKGMRD